MRKFLLGSLASLALIAGPAMAADMPVKAPVYKAPPPVVVYNWTGFYVGANVGYSWGRGNNDWNFLAPSAFGPALPCTVAGAAAAGAFCAAGSDSGKLNGAIGGFQAGYNWQSGNFLAGIETDIQISGQKGSQAFNTLGPLALGFGSALVSANYTEKLEWLGTLRGRLGITSDRWLVYATGGLAYGTVKVEGSALGTGCNNIGGGVCQVPLGGLLVPAGAWSNSVTKAGWTLGVGAEGAISESWSVKVEYLHVDLGKVNTAFAIPTQCTIQNPPTACGGFGNAGAFIPTLAGSGSVSSRITDDIIRVGVNYKFGGPVVARY